MTLYRENATKIVLSASGVIRELLLNFQGWVIKFRDPISYTLIGFRLLKSLCIFMT